MKFWSLSVVAAGLALALGPAAHAAPAVSVTSVRGQLQISEQQCGTGGCETAKLDLGYRSPAVPQMVPSAGRGQFPSAVLVTAQVGGTCLSDSPPVTIVAPDGSVQLLGPAERLERLAADQTKILVEARTRRLRIAWNDPLAPPATCAYLGDPMVTLAMRVPTPAVPLHLTSRWIPIRALQRHPRSVLITGTHRWHSTGVSGVATWHVQINLRSALAQPRFVG